MTTYGLWVESPGGRRVREGGEHGEDGGSKRRAAAEQAIKGRIEAFYFAFGETDGVVIADAPDNQTAARYPSR